MKRWLSRWDSWGSKAGKYNTCAFFNEERGMRCLVHGDGFVCAGDIEELKWFKKKLEGTLEIKKTIRKEDRRA